MEDNEIKLTEEQERMWKKLSTPYEPITFGRTAFGNYSSPYASYSTAIGYNAVSSVNNSIAIGSSAIITYQNICIGDSGGSE